MSAGQFWCAGHYQHRSCKTPGHHRLLIWRGSVGESGSVFQRRLGPAIYTQDNLNDNPLPGTFLTGATLRFGTSYVYAARRAIDLGIGVGMTRDVPDFQFSVSTPFRFSLARSEAKIIVGSIGRIGTSVEKHALKVYRQRRILLFICFICWAFKHAKKGRSDDRLKAGSFYGDAHLLKPLCQA